jgi:hypothetical protein
MQLPRQLFSQHAYVGVMSPRLLTCAHVQKLPCLELRRGQYAVRFGSNQQHPEHTCRLLLCCPVVDYSGPCVSCPAQPLTNFMMLLCLP